MGRIRPVLPNPLFATITSLSHVGPEQDILQGTSSQHTEPWLAIIKASARGFYEVISQRRHALARLYTGLVEQRLGALVGTDRLQVTKGIHREADGRSFVHQHLRSRVRQHQRDSIENLRGRAKQLPV